MALRSRVRAGQRPDHPHLHRHAAGGPPARLRLPPREDARDRRARGRRRRVRAGLFPCAADAAGARLAPLRTAAVRDRRPGQCRVRRESQRAAAATDAPRPRLRNRRRGVDLPAPQGNRRQPGLRFLRRRDAAGLDATGDRTGASRRRRIGSHRRALAGSAALAAPVPVPDELSTRLCTEPGTGSRICESDDREGGLSRRISSRCRGFPVVAAEAAGDGERQVDRGDLGRQKLHLLGSGAAPGRAADRRSRTSAAPRRRRRPDRSPGQDSRTGAPCSWATAETTPCSDVEYGCRASSIVTTRGFSRADSSQRRASAAPTVAASHAPVSRSDPASAPSATISRPSSAPAQERSTAGRSRPWPSRPGGGAGTSGAASTSRSRPGPRGPRR